MKALSGTSSDQILHTREAAVEGYFGKPAFNLVPPIIGIPLGFAQVESAAAERAAENSQRWRDRRSSGKHLDGWIRREAEAHQRWETHVAPEAARLDNLIALQKAAVEILTAGYERGEMAAQQLAEQAESLRRIATRLVAGLEGCRNQVDGISRPSVSGRSAVSRRQIQVTTPPAPERGPQDAPSLGPKL